jgi:HlyD family secretion protein
VDAYPDRTFTGKVQQVRLQPTTVQNVVSYNTIITVKNDDLRLMPGMTASVSVIVKKRENAVRVPSAALRFRPAERTAGQGWGGGNRDARPRPDGAVREPEAARPTPGREASGERGGGRRREGRGERRAPEDGGQRGLVFVPGETGPQPVRLTIGASDGPFVEVLEGLDEGAMVITGVEGAPGSGAGRQGQSSSPFSPQFQRRQR